MRRLMLLRHAKAEKGALGAPDMERVLAARGHEDARRLGAYMAHHALAPDLVMASPAERVKQTWSGIALAFDTPAPVRFEERLYNASADQVLKLVRDVGADVHTLLVIGHNPGLQDLGRLLIASGDVEARERLNEGLPTTGLLVIEFPFDEWRRLHPHCGRLDRFISPRMLDPATD